MRTSHVQVEGCISDVSIKAPIVLFRSKKFLLPGEVIGLPGTNVAVHDGPGVLPPLVKRLALVNPGVDLVPAPTRKVKSDWENSPVDDCVLELFGMEDF